jgi:hypothetical protein
MIKLDLTINEVNAILLALAKLPYETVAPLIAKVREQSLPQVPADERNDNRRDKLQEDLLKAVNEAETVTPE